ncbi:5-hydroxytryptamine receptor 3A-like [Biomphalaria glabrata]|uniref:5-hydroxytryptamine receptor 3A-like n=1 Tax=Biomphalaria glabrata TaxID=6526 RepID=A0A9U8E6G7_BIOGL|nr:5-hydroxytryptamine receptor 3A-like [Biomphalaria glabrata]
METKRMFCVTTIFVLISTLHGHVGLNVSAYARLRNDLLSRDAVIHQVSPRRVDPKQNFTITLNLVGYDILDIDQIKQTMTIFSFMTISWKQEYLSWDPSLYDNQTDVSIETSLLWKPYIFLLLGYTTDFRLDYPEKAIVDWTGQVDVYVDLYINLRCAIDFVKYPFDSQICRLGLYAYVDDAQIFRAKYRIGKFTFRTNVFSENGEWRIQNYSGSVTRDINDQTYPIFDVKLQRRPGYYVITVITPLLLTSVMISLVFLIPPGSGEKISFFVTLYTSLAIFVNFVSNVMPRNVSSAPYLILLLIGVSIQGLLANLATLFVVKMYEKQKDQMKKSSSESRSSKQTNTIHPEKIAVVTPENSDLPLIVEEKDETKQPKMPLWFRLSPGQWDNLFFLCFTSAQVLLMGTIFGATDWLADAPSLAF